MTIENLHHADGWEVQLADNAAGLFSGMDISTNGTTKHLPDHARTGAGALQASTTINTAKAAGMVALPALTSVYAGFGFAHTGGLTAPNDGIAMALFALNSGAGGTPDRRLSLAIDVTNHNLVLYADDPSQYGWLADGSNNVTPAATGSAVLGAGIIHYLEIFADRTSVVVRVNGATDINYQRDDNGDVYSMAHLGIVRRNSRTTFSFANYGGLGVFHFDDFVLADDWPDGARLHWYTPDADGSHSDWTSTGADYHGEISELSTYGASPDTDKYLSSATPDDRASVNVQDPAESDGIVMGVMPVAYVRNTGGGQDMAQFLQVGAGSPIDLPAFTSPVDWGWRADPLAINPGTGQPFTPAELADLQTGWKVID